jgi:uncharacterized membrane protein YfcA
MVTLFSALVIGVGVAAGAVAGVAGFGVGSLLTPLLTTRFDGRLAVALVAIPHAIATALRLWHLRHDVSRRVLANFGVLSAIGGLVGAYLFTRATGTLLERVLGVLLVGVGTIQITGRGPGLRFSGPWVWIAGALSGLFGGLVGNQGGLRSAGLLAFPLSPREFVATAAAIALIVDAVRLPLYLWQAGTAVAAEWRLVALATIGVVIGTFAGTALLLRLPAAVFRRLVGAVLLALGAWLLVASR